MCKTLAAFLFVLFANAAFAEGCPPNYRFVDFGVEGSDGVLRRGGTIFRAFDGNGTALLLHDRSICRAVEELSKDGRALPIPVVSSVEVDLEVAGLDLAALQMIAVDDAVAEAEASAARHRATLALPDAVIQRGDSYLCAAAPETDAVSCQIISPYTAIAPLVVYCDARQCRMPVLARDENLAISAGWQQSTRDPAALAQDITGKVQNIYDFLEEQI